MEVTPNYVPLKKDCSQQLRYLFNSDELREQGKRLAETHSKLDELDKDKKRVTSEFTSKINAVKAEAGSLSAKVNTGYELRDILCTAVMDTPKLGMKRITRNDTGEVVSEEPMTPTENRDATDARAKAKYDHEQPALKLVDGPAVTVKEGDGEEEADGEGTPMTEEEKAALTTSEEPDEEEAEKPAPKKKKAAKPGEDF